MKRLLSLLGMLIVALSTFAQTFTVGDLTYYVTSTTNKTVQVFNGKNATGDVVVPEAVTYNNTKYSVTAIGDKAFYQNANITSVSMPSVTSIGKNAFDSCSSLATVSLTAVESIGYGAFMSCSSLISVSIPTVTTIGSYAFFFCSKIKSLRIGSAGQWCAVKFGTDSASPLYMVNQSVDLYIGDSTKPATSIDLPSTAKHIPAYAFASTTITSLSAPSVASVGSCAFYRCSALNSVSLPSVKSVGSDAFYSCKAVSSLHIGSIEQWCGVQFDNDFASPLHDVYQHVDLYIGDSTTPSKNLEFPNVVKEIPSYAFANTSLTSLSLPLVTSIGAGAFKGCSRINAMRIGSIEQWCKMKFESNTSNPLGQSDEKVDLYIGNSKVPATNIDVPNTVTEIPDKAFAHTTISSLSAPSVVSVGNSAFFQCAYLYSVSIPAATSLGTRAFFGCYDLASADFPLITSIGEATFSNCSNLVTVNCPAATFIGNEAFNYCRLLESVNTPSVTTVGLDAFSQCSSLTNVNLPAVTSIDAYAFAACRSLVSISLPSLTSIGGYCQFSSCSSLTSVYAPLLTNIEASMFCYCKSLESVILSLEMTHIGELAFVDCSSISSIVIPKSVLKIDRNAFSGCSQLLDIYYTGTESEWNAIIGIKTADIPPLTTIHYSCSIPSIDEDENVKSYTDVAKYGNIVFFNDTHQLAGKQITLPLMMNNTAEITAMQFDLVLPEGITLDKNARDKYALTFNVAAERTDASIHTLSSSLQPDGSIRVLSYSTDKEPFLGNSGAIIDFPLTISADIEPAEYAITLKNIILTAPDKTEYKIDEVVCKFIVPDYEMGDANGDDQINVTDIVYTADYILGNADPEFNELAADMNEDGEITVTDIVYIADKILVGYNGVKTLKGKAVSRATTNDVGLSILPFNISQGKGKTVTLDMDNPGREVTAFQCDVYLPEGITIDKNNKGKYKLTFDANTERTDASCHTLSAALQSDGAIKFLCYSVDKEAFYGENGAVVDIPLTADATMTDGEYEIRIENIVLTCTDKSEIKPSATTTKVTVGNTTTMQAQLADNTVEAIYNVSGQHQSATSNGINILRMNNGTVRKIAK